MQIVNCVLSRYGRNSKTVPTMARHSRCIVLYLLLVLVIDREQYQMGLVMLKCCTCNNTHCTWRLDASVSRVTCPVQFENVRTGDEMSAPFRKFMD